MFDIVVNGGGQFTLLYQKEGFLAGQRPIVAPWRDYAWLPDVVMIPFDTTVTAVDLSVAAMQVARGSPVSDADGARRATILFPQGTTATMVLPDGTTRPLTTLKVRATEYTIGASGPKAMPAPLPPSSGYTYAAEFSADEGVAAGATALLPRLASRLRSVRAWRSSIRRTRRCGVCPSPTSRHGITTGIRSLIVTRVSTDVSPISRRPRRTTRWTN